MALEPGVETVIEEEVEVDIQDVFARRLTIFNDDVNTFQHVIQTLQDILNMELHQAEQCAMLVHFKGKCAVKDGTYDDLKPYKDAICERGIDAKIV